MKQLHAEFVGHRTDPVPEPLIRGHAAADSQPLQPRSDQRLPRLGDQDVDDGLLEAGGQVADPGLVEQDLGDWAFWPWRA